MLRFAECDIVFQEIPDEVTLAVSISGCPNHCKGCHSPYLWEDVGEPLTETVLLRWLATYGYAVTCVCFMGGDNEPEEVNRLAGFLQEQSLCRVKVAWYSGKRDIPACIEAKNFHFIKLGPYVKSLGGLTSRSTNQRLYRNEHSSWVDVTDVFWSNAAKET